MFSQIKKILILSPHPDDVEFGLGGTLSKLIELGKEIHLAVFSNCEESTPKGFEKGIIKKEFYTSCEFLNISKQNIYEMDFKVRYFPAFRQEILEELIILRKKVQPDLIFLPSSFDIHQDHKTIHEEGIRAFKHNCLLGYEMPWNNFKFTSFVYVALKEEHFQKKIKAINLYKSQKNRPYSNPDFVRSLAIIKGIKIQRKYAEAFEVLNFTHF